MKSAQTIQLLDSQNNNIAPITSIESLYIDAHTQESSAYVRYRLFDRLPILQRDGSILYQQIAASALEQSSVVLGVNTEKWATGPNENDISIYKLKYDFIPFEGRDSFMSVLNKKIDDKLGTYLEISDVYGGDGISVVPHTTDDIQDGVVIDVSFNPSTLEIDSSGRLTVNVTGIGGEFGQKVEDISVALDALSDYVYNDLTTSVSQNTASITNINDSIDSIEEHLTQLDSSVNSLESDSTYMKKYIDFMFGGVTNYNSLSNIPIAHQSALVTLNSTASQIQHLSLADKLSPGQDMNIRVENLAAANTGRTITIYLTPYDDATSPDQLGAYYDLMTGQRQYLYAGDVCEINVWCYRSTENETRYSVKYIFREIN